MGFDGVSPGIGKPLTLTEVDICDQRWVLWVRKLSLQRYVAKTALSPDKQLLVSVAGLQKRWKCSRQYILRLIKDGRLELTVIEDPYGHKVGVGISYGEVRKIEKAAKWGKLHKANNPLTVEP